MNRTDSNYITLANVLQAAYDQAATGKGAERHANGLPWTEQPIFTIADQVGEGFNAGQTIKKVQEAHQMAERDEYDRAMHEVLGAIVYAASLYVIWSGKRATMPTPSDSTARTGGNISPWLD